MDQIIVQLLIVCPLVFLAGFADSIAGGGGIISIPAYLFAGLPVHFAYGTNKFAMSLGTMISAFKYTKSGNVNLRTALIAASGALVGSNFGARLALMLDERYLQITLMVLLPLVALFLVFNKGFGKEKLEQNISISIAKQNIISLAIGIIVGGYDGFFGPGAGTFYVLLFTGLLNHSLLISSGNAKIVNLASNIGALVAYILGGKVLFIIGIPAAICAIAGNYLGSSLAIKNGAKFIRPVIFIVIILLFGKIVLDIL